ncbi:MAG: hypothetical protein ACLFM7_11640 [Bacteroidales bacterium]
MTKRKSWNSLKLGVVLGIAWPVAVMILFYFVKFANYPIGIFFEKLTDLELFSKFISVCVYPNLLLFFIFIWKNRLYSARGVLLATILLGFLVVIMKFT